MKGHIPQELIEEIRTRADILSIVSEYLTLKKAGRNYLGLCPFHEEKTPSFTVSPEKQMFYCFGCGAAGHVFTFLMKLNNMTFPEVARELARKTGVVIPETGSPGRINGRGGIQEQLCQINELAREYFSRNLNTQAGKEGRSYLKARGLRDETVRTFSLGYAPAGWSNLRDYLKAKKVPWELASQAGLIVPRNGEYYDRFRQRLIFPIFDAQGQVLAFGGRALDQSEPKYLNSPETPVYIKGKNLYGLHATREKIRKKDTVIMVEGYFDFLSLWEGGIDNVVATLGTALTDDQVRLMKRYAGQVILMYDRDRAGKKALERSLEMFLAAGVQARVALLPEGYDPDGYIRAFGPEKTNALINNAHSLVDYYIDEVIGEKVTFEEKTEVAKRTLTFTAKIEDPLSRDLFLKRVSERLAIDHSLLKKEVSKIASPSPKEKREKLPREGESTPGEPPEWGIIQLMLEYPERISEIFASGIVNYFSGQEMKTLAYAVYEHYTSFGLDKFNTAHFIDTLPGGFIRERLMASLINPFPCEEKDLSRALNDMMRQIIKKSYRERHRTLGKELARAEGRGDGETCNNLIKEKARLLEEEREALDRCERQLRAHALN